MNLWIFCPFFHCDGPSFAIFLGRHLFFITQYCRSLQTCSLSSKWDGWRVGDKKEKNRETGTDCVEASQTAEQSKKRFCKATEESSSQHQLSEELSVSQEWVSHNILAIPSWWLIESIDRANVAINSKCGSQVHGHISSPYSLSTEDPYPQEKPSPA